MKKLVAAVLIILVFGILFFVAPGSAEETETKTHTKTFDPKKDLISLHYDHAPDKDDGHSVAADRTILESMFGAGWIKKHVIPVSGTYGKNREKFNPRSDFVMKAAWDSCGGWYSAHERWRTTANEVADRWIATIKAGGDVWVKEGGQSDFTASVVQSIKHRLPDIKTREHIHVVQHSKWNEEQTTEDVLAYTRENTDYIRIRDANAYLNEEGGDDAFVRAAANHPTFGEAWRTAFAYYDPKERLDFSDTGELFHILGMGEISIDEFRKRYLLPKPWFLRRLVRHIWNKGLYRR